MSRYAILKGKTAEKPVKEESDGQILGQGVHESDIPQLFINQLSHDIFAAHWGQPTPSSPTEVIRPSHQYRPSEEDVLFLLNRSRTIDDFFRPSVTITAATWRFLEPDQAVVSPIASQDLADGFRIVEHEGLLVDTILMNPLNFSDVRKWDRNMFEPETMRSLMQEGVFGMLWGARFIVRPIVPENIFYLLTTPEFGRALRISVEPEPALSIGQSLDTEFIQGLQEDLGRLRERIETALQNSRLQGLQNASSQHGRVGGNS